MTSVRLLDFGAADDLAAYHEVYRPLHREVWPDNPPRTIGAFASEHAATPAFVTARHWLLEEDGRPVGIARLRFRDGEDNRHLAMGYAGVLPGDRRRGLGSRLMHEVVRAALDAGRTSIIFDGDSMCPDGSAALERLGGSKNFVARISRLDLSKLDLDLMRSWQQAGERRSDAFEMLLWDDYVPEEHIEAFAHLHQVMNSAPTEDLDIEPFVLTPEQLRAYEESRRARGIRWWCAVVRHRGSGEFAGFTNLFQPPEDDTMVYQGDTGVHTSFRRNGLGRWLKAVNILRVLPETPNAKWVETGNAGSNRPMLAINEEMGFYPYKHITAWQFDARKLADRTAAADPLHEPGAGRNRASR